MANSSHTSAISAMARNVESTLETQHMEKVLQELEGSPRFEKTLTRSHDPIRTEFKCGPALPAWFVQEHGDKFQEYITLRSSSSTKQWKVRLNIYKNLRNLTRVKFASGWKEFAALNDLKEGDSLIFSLVAMSDFVVYVIPGSGKCSPCQSPVRKWHNDRAEISRKKAKMSHTCSIEHSLSERNVGKTRDERCKLIGKKAAQERDDVAEPTSHSVTSLRTSPRNSLHLLQEYYSSPNSSQNSQNSQSDAPCDHKRYGSAENRGAKTLRASESEVLAYRNNTKSLPGFRKRLTVTNTQKRGHVRAFMEIPTSFLKSHGKQLQACVHLQGISAESPIRSVTCSCSMAEGVRERVFFKAGWTEFVKENGLRAGQELDFLLAGESLFMVREV